MCDPKRIAVVVGHTPDAPGAVSVGGVSEYDYNNAVAGILAPKLKALGHEVAVVHRGRPNDYRGLPAKVNKVRPDLVLSLHFNAFGSKARGSEMLYCKGSAAGERLARALQIEVVSALGVPDRGLKPRIRAERGGWLLAKTAAPCVVCEPFFGSNLADWNAAKAAHGALATAYADGVRAYLRAA